MWLFIVKNSKPNKNFNIRSKWWKSHAVAYCTAIKMFMNHLWQSIMENIKYKITYRACSQSRKYTGSPRKNVPIWSQCCSWVVIFFPLILHTFKFLYNKHIPCYSQKRFLLIVNFCIDQDNCYFPLSKEVTVEIKKWFPFSVRGWVGLYRNSKKIHIYYDFRRTVSC